MKHDPDNDKWLMAIDTRLVEYDEYQDEYSEISAVPDDTSIAEAPPGGYGSVIADEAFSIPRISSLPVGSIAMSDLRGYMYRDERSFVGRTYEIQVFDYEGTEISAETDRFNDPGFILWFNAMCYAEGKLFGAESPNSSTLRIRVFDPETGQKTETITLSGAPTNRIGQPGGLQVTPTRFILATHAVSPFIIVFDRQGNYIAAESFEVSRNVRPGSTMVVQGVAATPNYIYCMLDSTSSVPFDYNVEAYTLNGTFSPSRSFNRGNAQLGGSFDPGGMEIIDGKLYIMQMRSTAIEITPYTH